MKTGTVHIPQLERGKEYVTNLINKVLNTPKTYSRESKVIKIVTRKPEKLGD